MSGKNPAKLSAVSRWARKKAEAEEWFIRAIADAAEEGYSYREIAEQAGVSKPRVGQIVMLSREYDSTTGTYRRVDVVPHG